MPVLKELTKVLGACVLLLSPLTLMALWNDSNSQQIAQVSTKPTLKVTTIKTSLPWLDEKRFRFDIDIKLPRYQKQFEKAAQENGIPWTLLASQAYQESRWNHKAKSPTGVRGLMMLTRNTASSLGIENRLDPIQSIDGGARYYAYLEKQVPKFIPKYDRIWIALAAYNVGMGHIKDAQTLARKFNKNPYRWDDLKTVLPLLAQKKYYKTLPYGYARGYEPIRYVKRIRDYWSLLERYLGEV